MLNLLYALFCTIEHIIYVELVTYNATEQCLNSMGGDFHPIAGDSLSAKDHVFLSSNNNPGSNTGDTGEGEASKPSIFTNPHYVRPVSPEKVPVPVEGQGDNPTLFTTAKPGEAHTAYNTFNISDGNVNSCEHKEGGNHH